MKKIFCLLTLTLICAAGQAQVLKNKGGLYIGNGAALYVNGAITNEGILTNAGNISTSGNITNNQTFANLNNGMLQLTGSNQSVGGSSAVSVGKLSISGEISLVTPLKAEVSVTFGDGLVLAPNAAAPLIFGQAATYSGTSDVSHVNGYVRKEGTGSFIYPVGDGSKYQPVATDLTENENGMQVRYFPSDAGLASFATTGASAVRLQSYNNQEYWDLSPVGAARGKVSVFWDGYKNPSITSSSNINVFKVAHRIGGVWQNKSGTASGNLNEGNVTSDAVSAWSPFTLGAVFEGALPVTLSSFKAFGQESHTLLLWTTTFEINSERFDVQRSTNGRDWGDIGSVAAVNNSTVSESYQFTDLSPLAGQNLYRLKLVDRDGSFAYSRIQSITFADSQKMTAYPNPARELTTVRVRKNYVGSEANLISASGNLLARIRISKETFEVDLGGYASGIYLLQTQDKETIRIIKQ